LETILGSGPSDGLTIRQEELRRSEFFQLPWVEEVCLLAALGLGYETDVLLYRLWPCMRAIGFLKRGCRGRFTWTEGLRRYICIPWKSFYTLPLYYLLIDIVS
jgi:hypothetical protein